MIGNTYAKKSVDDKKKKKEEIIKIRIFIKDNPTLIDNCIALVRAFISKFKLRSKVVENEEGYCLLIFSRRERAFIEKMLYYAEDEPTSLVNVFHGNVKYI